MSDPWASRTKTSCFLRLKPIVTLFRVVSDYCEGIAYDGSTNDAVWHRQIHKSEAEEVTIRYQSNRTQ